MISLSPHTPSSASSLLHRQSSCPGSSAHPKQTSAMGRNINSSMPGMAESTWPPQDFSSPHSEVEQNTGHRLPSQPFSLVFFNLIVSWSYFPLKLYCGEFTKSHLFKSAEQSLRTVPLLQSGDALLLYFPSIIHPKKIVLTNKSLLSLIQAQGLFHKNQDFSYNVELHFERTA